LVASSPTLAQADDEKAACLAEHEQGQVSRRAGSFDAAREQFAACTADACPPPVRKRCLAFLAELDAAQPTIVIALHDANGRDVLHGVSMTLDGGRPQGVPATALRLDPGEHMLRVFVGDLPSIDRPIVIREGEKERRIDIDVVPVTSLALPPAEGSRSRSAAPRISTGARVWMGVSAVGLVAAGTTSAIGWGIHTHLASTCVSSCTESQVEPMRVLWPISFVALGVGVVSGGVALTLVLTNRAPNPEHAGFYAAPSGVGWRF
jgi:hypothetical protein